MAEENARDVADEIARSLVERSGHQSSSLSAEQQREIADLTDELTRLLVRKQSIFVFTPPKALYSCDMPNNPDSDYLHNMKSCSSCGKVYCKKHNLSQCVNCGTTI